MQLSTKDATKLSQDEIKELFAVAVFRQMGYNPAFMGVDDEFALIAEVGDFIFIRDQKGLVIVDDCGNEVEVF